MRFLSFINSSSSSAEALCVALPTSQQMDFSLRMSRAVGPKAESALAALQMRLSEGSGARGALQRGEERAKRGSCSGSGGGFHLPAHISSLSLSYALRSSPRNAVLCRYTDALSSRAWVSLKPNQIYSVKLSLYPSVDLKF